jgi:galactonate dehydratase
MKITPIKPYVVELGARNQLLVKVETDAGINGWASPGFHIARRR